MRQIIIGHSDSTSLGTYKVVIGKDANKILHAMQSKSDQHHALKKPKRFRSAFTTEQTNYLEEQFKKFQYINREQRQKVASILKIGERPIKIWFQNRRMKEKKENHKEFNDEICGNSQKICKGPLNNISALPSTNDQRSYSLPILSITADTTANVNTNSTKSNIVENDVKQNVKPESPNSTTPNINEKVKGNFYEEANVQEHLSPYFDQQSIVDTSVPFTKEKKDIESPPKEYKRNKSDEFSINLCKKYKQELSSSDATVSGNTIKDDLKMKKGVKQVTNIETNRVKLPKDLPPTKKCKVSYPLPPKQTTQMNLNSSMFYPVMPSMYTPTMTSLPPPYMAPDGVIWKPVNFMPVMATNPMDNIAHQASSVPEQIKTCICNCHGSSQHTMPVNIPPGLQNPYAQYVFTAPFSHPSNSF